MYERTAKAVLSWDGEAREAFIDELDKWSHSAGDLKATQAWLHEVVVKGAPELRRGQQVRTRRLGRRCLMAGPSSPAQPPGGSGTIDVKPSDLWSVSGRVAAQQDFLVRGAKTLLEELGKYPDAGGAGTEAEKFAQAYKKIGNRWLEVWGRSVLSVGGVAVGFTETANAYTKADVAAHPKPGKTAEQRPRPTVIDKAPNLGSIPDIKWGDDDGGDDILRGLMEGMPEIVRDLLHPLCKNVFRVGRVADVYPYPEQHYLNSLCHSWMNVSITASRRSGPAHPGRRGHHQPPAGRVGGRDADLLQRPVGRNSLGAATARLPVGADRQLRSRNTSRPHGQSARPGRTEGHGR
ncbi:hypothetical protein ACF07L_09370 [Streptomyces anulatus]|uniref:hypothetical protein n=1 Tax=Streptomyces anulatus TaxID=1892 RepID=UPI0036F5D850